MPSWNMSVRAVSFCCNRVVALFSLVTVLLMRSSVSLLPLRARTRILGTMDRWDCQQAADGTWTVRVDGSGLPIGTSLAIGLTPELEPLSIEVRVVDPPLRGRDVRRLPLHSFIVAAIAVARVRRSNPPPPFVPGKTTGEEVRAWLIEQGMLDPDTGFTIPQVLSPEQAEANTKFVKALQALPAGRPKRGHSEAFYLGILAEAERLKAAGVRNAAKDIARRKREDPNTVHQWMHRGRLIRARAQRRAQLTKEKS